MNATVRSWWQQWNSRFSRLSGRQKRNLAIAAAALAASIAASVWILSRPHYVTIMSGLDAKSLGEVQSKLEDLKIPSEINGTSVLVPQRDADEARIQLAMAGLPDSGYVGYGSVSSSFGMTEDQFNIQVLDALQQSLDHTIESIDGIENAQVHIVMPQEQVFVSQPQDTAKASVFVQLGTGVQLSSAQVAGIQQLVAHAVKGLTADNVTVVDQNGVNLSSSSAQGATTGGTELAERQQMEQNLEQKLTAGLDQIVGPGNAVVVVHANVTFDRVKSKSHVVQPVPGQDTGLPKSQQVIRNSTNTQGTGVGGPAGQSSTNPGLPTYAGNSSTGSSSQSTDDETTTTYDNSYTDTTTVHDPIQINGYDVGVMLNSGNTKLSPAVLRRVQQFVQNAVGTTAGAGARNSVSVMQVPFQTPVQATVNSPLRVWWFAAALGALLAGAGVWLWLRRRNRSEAVEPEPLRMPVMENPLPEPELTEEEQMKRQLSRLAEQRPEEFANLIRTWLVSD
ncbi:MAG: flagellar M-ring protein FliF [Alicyclobacillus herbarius]|uniref:flagellar basal-body MS-ring/collar protein FliF n=1 Tax=Alicyclobacillus herbarius TaxID=122960 RepID=UPI002356AD96|nr:flagellar basal-body MS-ring/collar protein FliF [Alicyclobacillus herbarius]MCL6632356.1 flagellar M-ring protein FliF [Alicyclobacillus herbarius]